MIVFTDINKFNELKEKYISFFQSKSIDIVPIEFKTGWFITENLQGHEDFGPLITELLNNVEYEKRELNEDELITYDL